MKLALQLETFRDILKRDWREAVHKAVDVGYEAVELSGVLGESDVEAREELGRLGLQVMGVHFDYQDLYGRLDPLLQTASNLGAEWVVINHLQMHQWADGWDVAGDWVRRLTDAAREYGLQAAYNTHKLEFKKDNGSSALEHLLVHAGESVMVDFDVLWASKAGEDPAEWIRKLAPRIAIVHLNDDPGRGVKAVDEAHIDWQAVVAAADESGVEWAVVERGASPTDPVDGAKASRDHFLSLGVEA